MLQDKVKLQMDAATYFDYSSAAPGANALWMVISHSGALLCYEEISVCMCSQRSALDATSDWHTAYNTSLLDSTTIYSVAQARFSSLVTESMKRNG